MLIWGKNNFQYGIKISDNDLVLKFVSLTFKVR